MIRSKKAALGESVLMLYRLIMITIIAFVIFGISAVFYTYYIDVRHSEAGILSKQVINCISPEGILDLNKISGYENKILDYCKIKNTGRFYVNVTITGESGKEMGVLQNGDSGLMWVKDLYDSNANLNSIKQYAPGFYHPDEGYNVQVIDKAGKYNGVVNIDVLVNNEF